MIYTKREQIVHYTKRFLKFAVPLAVVMIPVIATTQTEWSVAGWVAIAPVLTTLDKFLRDHGVYQY